MDTVVYGFKDQISYYMEESFRVLMVKIHLLISYLIKSSEVIKQEIEIFEEYIVSTYYISFKNWCIILAVYFVVSDTRYLPLKSIFNILIIMYMFYFHFFI